ncbi:glycosyltransferase family 39 protein [Leptolyngbya cf. ectocarpi LEGE 11479]|uniref:Glycosyltransferase family 39 protein n=1 Tax=Leptolyngbya cf. ectocarpi LEGE 11479 TaxID=1828722 RepID=A0A928ZYR3_LEPEC|nr:glycosyltransferase family 39 protein [Leptolyngbya ectocarpi]MBE9069912.1 glycosyltransferase family 39 protein [Leptolyngbya cf. ectocarpi LEGE 11479]
MNLNQMSPVGKQRQNSGLQIAQWLPITLVLILATVLCFYRINGEGLWLDELTSIRDAQVLPTQSIANNLVRPLYYILLMVWMKFGSSDAWLRSLSVIFALIAVFLLYRLGRRLFGETEGLIAATLMSLSPLFLNHAQEVRMYALSVCMGVAGTLCLARALTEKQSEAPPSHALLAGWCAFRLLATLTVPLNITLLLPDVLIYWLRFRQQRAALIRFGKWLALLLLLWSPCVLSVLYETSPDSTYASHHPGRKPPGLDNVVRTLKFWTVWPFAVQANAIAATFYKLFTFLVAGLMGAALIQKHKSPQVLWASAWFVIPLVPILFFSYLSVPIWVNRYLLFVSPYLFLVLAAGLSRLWRQWRIAAIAIALAYLIAVSGGLVRYYTVQDRPDYKFIVETIEQYEQPQDVVVWGLFAQRIILNHYYQGSTEFYQNKTRGISTDAEISTWLDNFPDISERLWLVLKVKDQAYPRFEQQIKTRYVIEDAFDYEQGSKVLLLTQQ